MQYVIYPQEEFANSVAIIIPTGEIPIEEVARKDVPKGIPYLIVNKSDMPFEHYDFADSWEADFSNPHGYGIGHEAWFKEQESK